MKKQVVFLILIFALSGCGVKRAITAVSLQPQTTTGTITYTASNNTFANPERGFYHYIETRSSSPNLYDLTTLQNYRQNENITLLYCIHYLDTFSSADISTSFLNHIETNLNTVRDAGLKCILRFAYTDDWNNEEPPYGDAPKTRILGHLDQLTPILQTHADVIATLQAGFIGVWGEWYYTSYFVDDPTTPWVISASQWAERHEVLSKELTILPPSRAVAVRYAHAKQNTLGVTQPLTPTTAHQLTEQARTGYHNDCFLASDTDFGTWLDPAGKTFMAEDSQFLPMGGETCVVNPPRTDCPTAQAELALFHWSYLNIEFNEDVVMGWQTNGCFDTIAQKLGYRLQLLSGTYTDEVARGGLLAIDLNLQNVGYSAPFNPRPVQLLLRHTSNNTVYALPLPEDPRTWFAGETQTLAHTLCIPTDMPAGQYDLLLSLPDRMLLDRPEYAILLANSNGVQEPATGYNNLGHTVTIQNTTAGTPCTNSQWAMLGETAVSPHLSITHNSTQVDLTWAEEATHCVTDLYAGTAPYTLTLLDDTLSVGVESYQRPFTSPSYYQLQVKNCAGTDTALSNTVGLFTFDLVGGTP